MATRLKHLASKSVVGGDLGQELAESYAVNERMFQMVLEDLQPVAWRAKLADAKGRTITDIVAHTHNMRRKWLRLSAPHLQLPAPLLRATCTPKQARMAMAESATRCCEMIAGALTDAQPSVRQFHRDGWARPWPAGAAMVAYMITHDAHHRGQICLLAHQLGFPLRQKTAYSLWGWERLWQV